MSSKTSHDHYIPGLGRPWRTPLYDLVHRLAGIGKLHDHVIDVARPAEGQRVLDIGCGTGNLLLALGARQPGAHLTGLDPDPAVVRRARRKAARAHVPMATDQGFAQDPPYADGSFDLVLSTLMFHHLDEPAKEATLAAVRRVLRPGGALVLADFAADGHHHGRRHRRMRQLVQHNGDLAGRIEAAGLTVRTEPPYRSKFGEVQIITGTKAP